MGFKFSKVLECPAVIYNFNQDEINCTLICYKAYFFDNSKYEKISLI